jgi:hypothetical protein
MHDLRTPRSVSIQACVCPFVALIARHAGVSCLIWEQIFQVRHAHVMLDHVRGVCIYLLQTFCVLCV